jgi:hypothetical protein
MISDELRLLVPNQRGAQTKNPCAAGRLEPGAVKPDMGFYVYSTSEPKPLFKPVASNGPTNQTPPNELNTYGSTLPEPYRGRAIGGAVHRTVPEDWWRSKKFHAKIPSLVV